MVLDFFINALLYSDDVMHKKYENEGEVGFLVTMALTISSNIITSIVCNIFKFIQAFEERISLVMQIKYKKKFLFALNNAFKLLKSKTIIMFLFQFIFLLISIYYISIFFTLYPMCRVGLTLNYFISLAIQIFVSLIVSFSILIVRQIGIICLKERIYNLSKYINRIF